MTRIRASLQRRQAPAHTGQVATRAGVIDATGSAIDLVPDRAKTLSRTIRSFESAGIWDPRHQADIEACRRLFAQHGSSYYLASWLLPAHRRPWLWSLYGFVRYADEMVDSLQAPDPERLRALSRETALLLNGTSTQPPNNPYSRALLRTVHRWDIDPQEVLTFLAAMEQDITVTCYPTYDDLRAYMRGSATAVAAMLLPILGGRDAAAFAPAQALAEAFQLTNFIRDIGEDLNRGRLYLPVEDLVAAGVSVRDLEIARSTRFHSQAVINLIRNQVERAWTLYAQAEQGIGYLALDCQDSIRCALRLYSAILTQIEAAEYRIVDHRVFVPHRTRARLAAPAAARALATRA